MKLKRTLVIGAFPACGKSYATEKLREEGYEVLDSDSIQFSWHKRLRTEEELQIEREVWEDRAHLLSGDGYINTIKNEKIKVRNPDFPANYIQHIKENIGKVDVIFISSHPEVRKALYKEEIPIIICIPNKQTCLAEWVGRCYLRGSDKSFIDMIIKNWDSWLADIHSEIKPSNINIVQLENNEHCYDLVENLIEMEKSYYEGPEAY